MKQKPDFLTLPIRTMTDFEQQNHPGMNIIEEINHEVLKYTEDVALGSLYQSVSHAMSLGALNAVAAQQQSHITAQAVTTMGATTIYSVAIATDTLFIARQELPGAGIEQ